jgi:hypothetical protein
MILPGRGALKIQEKYAFDSFRVRAETYRNQDKKEKNIVNNRLATARLVSMLGNP